MRALLPPVLILTLAATQSPQPTTTTGAAPVAPGPAQEAAAPRFEKLRYNPRERTVRGLERLEHGDAAGAVESFEIAGRLASTNPVARFNAGTAELLAGAAGAVEHLEFASEASPPDLAPAAHFNLGNARLAAGDAAGAIEAYKASLRRVPGDRDVKHNLELALKAQQQKQQQQQQQQQQEPQEQGQQEQEQKPPGEEPEDQPGDGESEEPPQEPGELPPDQQPPGKDGEQKLPGFADQPDMSAEQAAAILEAVENLERDERRRQAAERARRQGKKGKDW